MHYLECTSVIGEARQVGAAVSRVLTGIPLNVDFEICTASLGMTQLLALNGII